MTGFPAFCRCSSLGLWRRGEKRRMPRASGRSEGDPGRAGQASAVRCAAWLAGCDTCVVSCSHAACVVARGIERCRYWLS